MIRNCILEQSWEINLAVNPVRHKLSCWNLCRKKEKNCFQDILRNFNEYYNERNRLVNIIKRCISRCKRHLLLGEYNKFLQLESWLGKKLIWKKPVRVRFADHSAGMIYIDTSLYIYIHLRFSVFSPPSYKGKELRMQRENISIYWFIILLCFVFCCSWWVGK